MKAASWRSPKVERRESPISGVGAFAREDIQPGELLWIKGGHIVPAAALESFERRFADYALQIDDEFFLAPLSEDEIDSLVIFHNHSCEPNVGPEGQISFVALRAIAAGEELTTDYATIVHDEKRYPLEMPCSCGTAKCRGTITGRDWKLPELQKRYGRHFSSFILKRIAAEEVR
jgi:uncharacterized protein